MKTKTIKVIGGGEKSPPFIVLNEHAQVYTGLICGYPNFSSDWGEAKPLYNPPCLRLIQYGTNSKVEIHYM